MRALVPAILIAGVVFALGGCGASVNLPQAGRLTGGLPGAQPSSSAPRKAKFNPFEDQSETAAGRRVVIQNPTIAQVMQTGALTERALGRADAPVTIIKYASLTCPYCRKFHLETFPVLKREYIDTGKVRFIDRQLEQGGQDADLFVV